MAQVKTTKSAAHLIAPSKAPPSRTRPGDVARRDDDKRQGRGEGAVRKQNTR